MDSCGASACVAARRRLIGGDQIDERAFRHRLQRVIQAALLADGKVLDIEHFPSIGRGGLSAPGAPAPVGLPLRELEKRYILDTLQQVGGNRSKAAKLLQISVRGLHYKLQRYTDEDRKKPRGSRKRATPLSALQEPDDRTPNAG